MPSQSYWIRVVFVSLLIFWSGMASADLTKQDIEEIRRIVREEIQQEIQHVNARIDDLNTRINDLNTSLNIRIDDLSKLIYVILAGMFTLVGFVLWDRRTALAPVARKAKELEEEEEKIKRALREYALQEPRLAAILKQVGL